MAYATLHDRLRGDVSTALKKDLSIDNVFALPRIEKVVVNVGINKSKLDSKEMQAYIADCLMKITGQKPVLTRARKAISNFKVREGMVVGATVTLRGHRMEEFLDRLISYALPRIRDFRGLNTKLDGHGNYAIGLRDHSIFPEVPPADAKQIFGLQIQITTTTESDDEARILLKHIGMPFKPQKEKADANKDKDDNATEESSTDMSDMDDMPLGGGKTKAERTHTEEEAQEVQQKMAEEAAAPAESADQTVESTEAKPDTDSSPSS